MALRIRLRRMGRKNAPTYRLVVAESSMPRDGRIIENIGHYNPRTEPATLSVNRERALHWVGMGAVPTETAKALLKRAGVFRPEESAVSEAVAAVAAGAKKVASRAAGAVKGAAAKAGGAAKAVVEEVRETAGDVVEEVRETAAEVAETVREKVADAVEAVKGEESVEAAKGDESDQAVEEEAKA